jgi:hypothetical protein
MQVDKDIYDGYFYDDVSENNQLLFITPTGSVVNSKFYIYMSLNTINMSVSRLDCITVGINYYCSCFVTKNNKIKPNKKTTWSVSHWRFRTWHIIIITIPGDEIYHIDPI